MNRIINIASAAALSAVCFVGAYASAPRAVESMRAAQTDAQERFERDTWHTSTRGVNVPESKAKYLARTHAGAATRGFHSIRHYNQSAPMLAETAGGTYVIKGSLWYSDAWPENQLGWGMYSIPVTGGDLTLLTDPEKCSTFDYVANGGGTPFGVNKYFMVSYSFTGEGADFQVTNVMNAALDANTWEAIKSKLQTDTNGLPVLASISTAMAADPSTGIIYGSFYGYDDEKFSMGTYDPDRYNLNVISLVDTPWSACGFDRNGVLYALKSNGDLCKVDKHSGSEQFIGNTGIREELSSSGNINPADNMMYYALSRNNGKTTMYKIDLTTAKATVAFEFAHGEQMFGMYFDKPSGFELAPKAPADLTASFAGQLTGNVSFTIPTENVSGGNLSGDIDWEITVNYDTYKTGKGKPGDKVQTTVTVPEKGSVLIEATCSNEHGTGSTARVRVVAGDVPALPNQPTNFTLTEDTEKWGRTYASWTAPETDINGKPISPGDVVYYVSDRMLSKRYYKIPTTSLVHDMGDLSDHQEFESLTVQSGAYINERYEYNWDNVPATPLLSVGKPFPIPWCEPISNMEMTYNWVVCSSLTNGHWNLWDDINTSTYSVLTYNGDQGMVLFQAEKDNATSEMRGGKIDLGNAEHPTLILQLYRQPFLNEALGVVIFDANDEASGKLMGTYSNHAASEDEIGWKEIRVPLDEYKGKTIQIGLLAHCDRVNYFVAVDNIEVRNVVDNDLGVSKFSTPGQLLPGSRVSFGTTIRNWGNNEASAFTVTLYNNGQPIDSKNFDGLPIGQQVSAVFELTPNPLFDAKNEFYVEITGPADDDLSNNVSDKVTLDLAQYNYPAPTSLDGSEEEEGLLLNWDEPILSESVITDGFDTYEAYAISGFGQWTTYDGDGYDTYGIINSGTNQYPHFGEAQAWQIFSNSFFNRQIFEPYSGAQFAISFTSGGDNNDWLISPELSGNPQTISFYATGADIINPDPAAADHETFEILYSTTGTDVADFTSLKKYENIDNAWKLYEADLPAGARYFAIRHLGCYDDSFGLLVDDVTYECAGFDYLNLIGFNVYRDTLKLNDEPIGEMEYLVNPVAPGSHNYYVTAVYDKGESRPFGPFNLSGVDEISAVGNVRVAGLNKAIVVTGAGDSTVEVFNLAGLRLAVRNGDSTIALPAGIYLVKAGRNIHKVIVK